jgi:hypothetical protein
MLRHNWPSDKPHSISLFRSDNPVRQVRWAAAQRAVSSCYTRRTGLRRAAQWRACPERSRTGIVATLRPHHGQWDSTDEQWAQALFLLSPRQPEWDGSE